MDKVTEGRIGNAFACERCRRHKVRCVASDTGACQRCRKANAQCVSPAVRRRIVKTAARAAAQGTEGDERVDTVSLTVTATSASSTLQHSAAAVITAPSSQVGETSQLTAKPAPAAPLPTAAPLPAAAPLPPAPLPSVAPLPPVSPLAPVSPLRPVVPVSKPPLLPNPGLNASSAALFWEYMNKAMSGCGGIDATIQNINTIHMQFLVDCYRAMVDYFPFVPLPKTTFCHELLQRHPMLMFAIFTVTSYDSPSLQLKLSREFRKVAMVKLMNGERTLDLLQGLLIFIAWHHHYMHVQAASIQMLIHICIGIAADLGLGALPTPRSAGASGIREMMRAYLGCYYLSSSLSKQETGKLTPLTFSPSIHAYARDLAAAGEHESDAILPALVETCEFLDDVQETFQGHPVPAQVMRCHAKRLQERWSSLKNVFKGLSDTSRTVHWAQLAALQHLNTSLAALQLSDPDSVSWALRFQLDLRLSCVRSIETFLDTATKLDSKQFYLLSIVDWLGLVSAFANLGKLALNSSPLPGWDPADLQLSAMFERFRDRACARLPQPGEGGEPSDDFLSRFRRITATMKMTLKAPPGRTSPHSSAFEITSSSRQAVSILQDLPPLQPQGASNEVKTLPAPWKVNQALDMGSHDFTWKFLLGIV